MMRSRSEHLRWWAAPALVGAAALIAACGSSTSSPPASGGGNNNSPAAHSSSGPAGSVTIKTAKTSIGTVLVNSSGKTLYWFAKDTPTTSNCNGSCSSFWPPALGTASAGSTMMHSFGTITRSNGQKQITYNGHPLYTYVADTSPGMTSGNGKNLSGGFWWAMTPSGAKPSGGAPSPSKSSSSGGYGY